MEWEVAAQASAGAAVEVGGTIVETAGAIVSQTTAIDLTSETSVAENANVNGGNELIGPTGSERIFEVGGRLRKEEAALLSVETSEIRETRP